MNSSSIALLEAIGEGVSDLKELQGRLGLGKTQFYDLLKDLANADYIEKIDSKVTFKQNSKTILFRDVAPHFNTEKLLRDSNETVFSSLVEPMTVEELQRLTGLSLATIKRSLADLQSIGAVTKENDRLGINRAKDQLYTFAQILKTERTKKDLEPYAEIIFQNSLITLKRVPKGKRVEGELTGFSLFSDYGIEYHTTHDYYAKQQSALKLQDVLLHAIIAANKDKDKNGLIMSIIFYLKNKDELQPLEIRKVARECNITEVWLDVENFIRDNELKNPDLFPPRNEFVEKANLYGIPPETYTLPLAYPDLFKDIGKTLSKTTDVFLIGGENMRIKGLKARTKDCDIVVNDTQASEQLTKALISMGYTSLKDTNLSEEDKRLSVFGILVHPTRSRIDVFFRFIGRQQFYLSDRMIKRAKIETFEKLRLGILHNSDIFLLKALAAREGDIDDMAKIAQSSEFDWNLVWEELERQEHETRYFLSAIVLDGIDFLAEQRGIKPPFYKKLVRRVTEKHIDRLLRDGEKPMREVVSMLEGKDISESVIRHRIDYLEKTRHLRKVKRGVEVMLEPRMRGPLNTYPKAPVSGFDEGLYYIRDISTKMGYSEDAKRMAEEILGKMNAGGLLVGKNPRAVAGGIMSISGIMTGQVFRSRSIARAARISVVSLNRSIKRIKTHLRL